MECITRVRLVGCASVCSAAMLWTWPAAAETFYVDGARPDDSGDGMTWAEAKRSVQAGVDLIAAAGDELRIKSGSYDGGLAVDSSDPDGTDTDWIVVRSDDGNGTNGDVTIRGPLSAVYGEVAGYVGPHPWSNQGPNYWRLELK